MKLPCEVCGTVKDLDDLDVCALCGHANCENCVPTCEHAIQNFIESLEETENSDASRDYDLE